MAAQLAEMLNISEDAASALYEASGGDMELAMNLHFGGDLGGGSGGAPAFKTPFDWYGLVWPDPGQPIPESWVEQCLEFKENTWGLVQGKNGPCGVLSVIQGYLIASLIDDKAAEPAKVPDRRYLAMAITRALLRSNLTHPEQDVQMCSWMAEVGGDITTTAVPPPRLLDFIMENLERYTKRGCLPLLVYSAILTRGVENVKTDVAEDLGEPPLVLPPFYICTSDLVALFLRGVAKGNTSSYNMTGDKQDWDTEIGILSYQEWESKIPLADSLKSPKYPIWILHGGDHFTTLYKAAADGPNLELWHWNGLPPGGPRLAKVKGTAPSGEAPKAPEKHKETYRKPKKGALEDVIQAKEEDKKARPGKHKTWRYELLLAVDDPSIKDTPEDPEESEEPTYDHLLPPEGPWRCATCYHGRYQTMCFGLNPAGDVCQHCGKSKKDALWSIWMHYEEMPPSMQSLTSKMFAPKFHVTLATKWPGITVEHEGQTPSV
eukprot:TRINITY_DN19922_c0_g1_i1.p1 TRINITY_DN19922_c0_g1~~TRINITY_DN19922_c0_g1_i1.p1  ORF type:complete len:503 (+),score=66.18 TRINITY_DN19922_c0_g1_i1:41-1510(+)